MKYCTHCGAEILDEAVICVKCGCRVEGARAAQQNNTLITLVKVFLILACVCSGIAIIPLAWCIPMTTNIFRKLDNGEPISLTLKVCTLLFVGLIPGILLLCLDENAI